MGGKSRLPALGDFPIVGEIMNSLGQSSVGLIHLQTFQESGGMLSGPVAVWGFKSLKSFK